MTTTRRTTDTHRGAIGGDHRRRRRSTRHDGGRHRTDTTAASGGCGCRPSGPDLGPENPAAGEPVKVGYFNDGTTAAVDHGDDTIVAEALVEYWNEYRGGIGGRPIELVYC